MKKASKAVLIGGVAIIMLLPSLSLAKGVTKGMEVGFKIGMNYADLFGEEVDAMEQAFGAELKSKWGICVGGFVQFNISKVFAIQSEYFYTMKGARMEAQIFGETQKITFNLSYLELPVLLKLMIPTQGSVRSSLFVGPTITIPLSAKMKVGETQGGRREENIGFGLVIGGGLDFGKLTFDARYNLGLTTLRISGPIIYMDEIKNGVISLKVGYSF